MSKMNGNTLDIKAENINKLKELFPEVNTDGKIDFEILKRILGEYTEDSEERYNFRWNGKGEALRISQTPSMGTLRPAPKESKDWEDTENLYIEGDNLEVLKLLQKSYFNKVKMIYIDPPYNTGGDFVYRDNFKDNIQNYKKITGQVDNEGKSITTNPEYNGRYHTDWLNMMYPRLRLARNLLTEDGVIFISIDDNETHNLRKICDEVFGEDNFIEKLIWKRRATPPNDRIIGKNHEYIIAYAKNINNVILNLQPRSEEINSRYKNPDNDKRGRWVASDLSANGKGGRLVESCIYPIKNPLTGVEYNPPQNKCWLYNKETMNELINQNRIGFRKNTGTPYLKRYLSEVRQGSTLPTIIEKGGFSFDSAKEIRSLFSNDVFEFSKPVSLLKKIVRTGSSSGDIVLDFFAGSSTTAHSVIELNAKDNGNRKHIMVQLPELTDKKSEAYKAGYKNIADIGKERIRRAGEKIKLELQEEYENANAEEKKNIKNPEELDIGFKTFKLDTSNIKEWNPGVHEDIQLAIEDSLNPYIKGRTEQDVVYEMILKMGLDLSYPVEKHSINSQEFYSIGHGFLMICLSNNIDLSVAKKMIKIKKLNNQSEFRVIFRDEGFNSDTDKTNIKETLKSAGLVEESFRTL